MDLINEFTRRGRAAYGLLEIPPKGKPLASSPDQPLPPLVKLEIDEGTKQRITREMADRVLQITFERRPDLWLAFSEEHRHEVLLGATDQFRDLLRKSWTTTPGPEQHLVEDGSLPRSHRAYLSHVRGQIVDRIRLGGMRFMEAAALS